MRNKIRCRQINGSKGNSYHTDRVEAKILFPVFLEILSMIFTEGQKY